MSPQWKTLLLSLLFIVPAHAFDLRGLSSSEDFKYDSYFEMNLQESNGKIDLLNFLEVEKKFPRPRTKYNRNDHFGTWVDDRRDKTCLNTRAKVLERDSRVKVQFGGARGCMVTKGEWLDPYTGQAFRDSRDIQIDHMVPLKQAYMTGAFEWTKQRRCLYANYLGNKFHLLPVSGSQNGEKGDKSPSEYIPPRTSYICQYLANWLKIKAIWNLRLTPTEAESIHKEVEDQACLLEDFQMTRAELQGQLNFIENNLDLCSN